MKQVTAKVITNDKILPEMQRPRHPGARNILGGWIIWLSCPEIAREAKPGQFIMVRCGEECLLPRPFSIHQVNDNGIALFFAVWADGKGTRWLSRRQPGNRIGLFGPLGNGFTISPTSHNLLLVAGGIGIAPLCFLAQKALHQSCSVTLLSGATTTTRLYPNHLLPPRADIITATEDGTTGKKGMITDLLPQFTSQADQIFACGPMAMYLNMALKKRELKLTDKPVQVSLEVRMGCGRGVCYGCTVKTKTRLQLVCQNGPVFNMDDILWDELNY